MPHPRDQLATPNWPHSSGQRRDIESQIEALKVRKPLLNDDDYNASLEKLLIELVAASLDKVRNRILTLCWCNAPALRWSVQYPFLVGAMPNRIARRSLNEVLDCTRAAEMKRYINGSEAAQAYSLARRLFPSD
jgi:hypothetical protein